MNTSITVQQEWNLQGVLFSYMISVFGSYCTIQLMEQWRSAQKEAEKKWLLVLASTSFGGCAIWAMHFTSVDALSLGTATGSPLEVHFEGYTTILSLALAISAVYGGLRFASRDSFHETLTSDGGATQLLFRLHRIVAGGVIAGLGVFGMHYCGMWALRTNVQVSAILWLLLLSIGVSCVAVSIAFWFLFRLLSYCPQNLTVRMISALVIGLSVCGTNYCVASTAAYTTTATEKSIGGFLLSSSDAAVAASHGSLILCYVLCAVGVLQNDHEQGRAGKNKAKVHVSKD